jgi:hypothetical protein
MPTTAVQLLPCPLLPTRAYHCLAWKRALTADCALLGLPATLPL